MLNRFGKSRSQIANPKRTKGLWVSHHDRRLMEYPHQILSRGGVHPGFAADRGVDHCQQGRRNLDERDASHERRSHETGKVADNSTAERDDCRVATEPAGKQVVGEASPGFAGLVSFPRRNGDQLSGARGESGGGPPTIYRPDV